MKVTRLLRPPDEVVAGLRAVYQHPELRRAERMIRLGPRRWKVLHPKDEPMHYTRPEGNDD